MIIRDHREFGGAVLELGFAIVVDIGKTLSKVSLWSRGGRMLDRQVRPNAPCMNDGLRCLDAPGISAWLVQALGRYARHPVEFIVPVAHGAGIAVIRKGALAHPPLDYEQSLPHEISASYLPQRDPFAMTGSPALPCGLNFGAQLHWLESNDPGALDDATLVPWAQYWAWWLTDVAVSEATSLGCHSDVWFPSQGRFSSLAERRGWAAKFAPLAFANEPIGTLRPALAKATGLPATVSVLAGLHDSNAALVAACGFTEIAQNEATVLSTGTWFIAMRLADEVAIPSLPEDRDCLVNVSAYGRPVPSARFMGGREIESVIEIDTRRVDIKPDQAALLAAVPSVLSQGAMLRPTLAPGTGPFPLGRGGWIGEPESWFERRAAACLYAAMVADEALDLIGSKDRLLIEGRFAEAEVFVRALASLRPDAAVYTANAHNDVSFGALRLIEPGLRPHGKLVRVEPLGGDVPAYRARWRSEMEVAA